MKIYFDLIQQTPEWFAKRKGVVTGKKLKAIVGTPKARQDALYTNIGERLTVGAMDSDENPRDRGNRLEDEARAMFEYQTGKKVLIAGLCESEGNQWMGFSPDGLIYNEAEDGKYYEGIEIKCPETKNYVKGWFENKVPEEYYPQVVQNFIVNDDLEKLYFVMYHPEIPVHPMHIIEVYRGDIQGDISAYKKQELVFLMEVEKALETLIKI